MQPAILSMQTLEEFYTQVILPQFGVLGRSIIWLDHSTIGPDSDAHDFIYGNELMVLVFDDYPTTTLGSLQENFDTNVVSQVARDGSNVTIDNHSLASDDVYMLRFGSSTPFKYVHNVTGYFQLFKIAANPQDLRIRQLKAKRMKAMDVASDYSAIMGLGSEILSLAEKGQNFSHLMHLAEEAEKLARNRGFDSLSNVFANIQLDLDCCESEKEMRRRIQDLKHELQLYISESIVNPSISANDKKLLSKYTLPIHSKMAKTPAKSPKLFIEMAYELNRLIHEEDLGVWAAANELSYALDRPQILADPALEYVVEKAYELDLPSTLRHGNPMKKWQEFYGAVEEYAANLADS